MKIHGYMSDGGKRFPEDALVLNPSKTGPYAVLDGYSSAYIGEPELSEGMTGGQRVVEILTANMLFGGVDINLTMRDIVARSLRAIRKRQPEGDKDGASMAAFQIEQCRKSINMLQVGDCLLIYRLKNGNVVCSPNLFLHLDLQTESAYNEELERTGGNISCAQKNHNLVWTEIKRKFANNPEDSANGYPVIDGNPDVEKLWWNRIEGLENIDLIIMMTDGASPKMTQDNQERRQVAKSLIKVFNAQGIKGLINLTDSDEEQTAYGAIEKEATILVAEF